MEFDDATNLDRKSGAAEGPAVSLSGTAKAPWADRLPFPL